MKTIAEFNSNSFFLFTIGIRMALAESRIYVQEYNNNNNN